MARRKLTDEQVVEIRKQFPEMLIGNPDKTRNEIYELMGLTFSVSGRAVQDVILGHTHRPKAAKKPPKTFKGELKRHA
jgi:rRNA processing protein Krr1/Pno1